MSRDPLAERVAASAAGPRAALQAANVCAHCSRRQAWAIYGDEALCEPCRERLRELARWI